MRVIVAHMWALAQLGRTRSIACQVFGKPLEEQDALVRELSKGRSRSTRPLKLGRPSDTSQYSKYNTRLAYSSTGRIFFNPDDVSGLA